MASLRFIFIFLKILCALGLLVFFVIFWMYFSVDVKVLKNQYPHLTRTKDSFEVVMKSLPPKEWVRLDEISHHTKWAIIVSEDWSFYEHEGVDFKAMKIALDEMIYENKLRGASTITQQMVKNLYLGQQRTLWRKLYEIILAQKTEKFLKKERILEIYLNIIEYGPGIYGIQAASQHYFKKPPSELNPMESAFLAMLLPSPKRYYDFFKEKRLTSFAREKIRLILVKLRMAKILTPEEYQDVVNSKLNWE
jgi:monofunctional biosynthetic peptidoglycan transglycosylase